MRKPSQAEARRRPPEARRGKELGSLGGELGLQKEPALRTLDFSPVKLILDFWPLEL